MDVQRIDVSDWTEEDHENVQEVWDNVCAAGEDDVYGELARLLRSIPGTEAKITAKQIRMVQSSSQRERLYSSHELEKRGGGTRTISAPEHPIKFLQQQFLRVCTALFPRHKCAHGFEPGRSPATHASHHVRKNWVWTIDIEDFFPSIHWGRVRGMFRVYPVEASDPAARALANLTTYDGSLPQGAPTSPILSNLICRKLDSRLFQWARDNGYAYTRYADDLTFSTNKDAFSQGDRSFIKEIVEDEGFSVHPDKERLMPCHGRQMVTGLIVNEKVNVPREFIGGLRALLHNVEEHGWKSQVARQKWLFDDGEEWERYRDGEMTAREFQEYDQRQSKKHLLVRPNAVMSKVQGLVSRSRRASGKKKSEYFSRAVTAFKQAVEGKINYIGQIKGRRNDKYRKLRDWYDYLKEFDDEVAKNYREIKSKVLTAISHQEKERLSRFQSLHRKARRGALDDVSQAVEELQNEVIELQWLSRTMEVDKYHNQIAKAARCAVASPVLTGTFFRYVNTRDGYFKELIHRSSDEDPHTTKDLLKRCRSILTVYDDLLPPTVTEVFDDFLGTCERVNRSASEWHPYEDQEFLQTTVRPFKQQIRFEDGGDGADLAGAIRERVEEVQEEQRRAGQSPVRYANPLTYNLRFNTYTPHVKDAVQLIVESTMTNSNVEETELEVTLNPVSSSNVDIQLEAVRLTILDRGGYLRSPKIPSQLFGGKLRKTTRFLRGLAEWRLSYRTKGGGGFQSDVLTADEYQPLPKAPDGVRHDLTFYF
jgi:hypothetical protein